MYSCGELVDLLLKFTEYQTDYLEHKTHTRLLCECFLKAYNTAAFGSLLAFVKRGYTSAEYCILLSMTCKI